MRPQPSYRAGLIAFAVVLVLALRAAPIAAPQGAASPQQPPTYRAGVTAVPIDVRVVDRAGRPVTDLRRDDFTLFEDDVRQPIVHFSQHVLEALAPGPGLRARADVPAFAPAAPQQRVFLVVLGAVSRRVAHLDVAVFCADAGRKIVGRTSRTLDITLTERRFAQLATQGLPYSVRIPLKAPVRFVKVIVYNYDANLLGSTVARMK